MEKKDQNLFLYLKIRVTKSPLNAFKLLEMFHTHLGDPKI